MSAVFGIYNLDGETIDSERLQKMSDALAHRGSDGADIWLDSHVGLGHRMLWNTPESLLESLPASNLAGSAIITADARIDNREELIELLELGIPSEKITDSQIILAAYEKWGEDCPQKLLGDFAFAIWDAREQKLFCARDHFGVKSLYYYHSSAKFIFATEVKALFCLPEVPQQLNETRIADYLTGLFHDLSITFYDRILRLPPAHTLTVSDRGFSTRKYWQLEVGEELHLNSDEEYAAALQEKFNTAVQCRLRSAFPVGSFLSGGLDSSSIACVAGKLLNQNPSHKLHTFSSVYQDKRAEDESYFVEQVLNQGIYEPHFIYADRISPLQDVEKITWHLDEPLTAFNLFIPWNLYHIARENNVRVMLDGFDGDTTISHGSGYMTELARSWNWIELVKEVKGFCDRNGGDFDKFLWAYIWYQGVKPKINQNKYSRKLLQLSQSSLRKLSSRSEPSQAPEENTIDPDFIKQINLAKRKEQIRKAQGDRPITERADHLRLIERHVMPYTLEILDKISAPFGIEARYPFWDKRLVEFCLSLPGSQKQRNGWNRYVMRLAMNNILPSEVQWRSGKTNHGSNFSEQFMSQEGSRFVELIEREVWQSQKYLNVPQMKNLYGQMLSKSDNLDELINQIWFATNLQIWLQKS